MAERKGWGSTVMGWFVVQDQAGESFSPGDAASIDDATARHAPAEPLNVFSSTPPPAAPGGNVDFDKVFDAAGIESEARERVGRTLELLNSLPPETYGNVKKQIVMASLK